MTERVEIICPCGEILVREAGDDRREIECSSCRRINVLPVAPGVHQRTLARPAGTGDTTTVQTPFATDIAPGTRIGPYEVTGVIGEGGMGKVYTAIDQNLQRRVALKVLSGELRGREAFVARFRREARAVARLNHPNIVQIYYTGTYGETPYYAMEMVDGENLDIVFKRGGVLEPARAAELMMQAARGLAAAASEGVIHRDVKPSNMVLEKSGVLKITDFGLAKTVSGQSDLTMTGTVVGTPLYMSPEQGESRSVDFRTDIYSLGASFYHLLAGTPPFEANSPVSIILKHINERLPPPDKINKQVPAGLSAIICKMMAKKPDDRYASYDDLVRDIASCLDGNEPGAVQWRERARKLREPADSTRRTRTRSFVIDEEATAFQEIRLGRASPLRRLLAFAADFGLLVALYRLLTVFDSQALAVPYLAFAFAYFFLADAKGGVTVGKAFFQCRIGRDDGEDLGFLRSFVRTVFVYVAVIGADAIMEGPAFVEALEKAFPDQAAHYDALGNKLFQACVIWLFIDGGYAVFGPTRRALHDVMTGTHYFRQLRPQYEKPSRKEDAAAGIQRLPKHPKDPVLAAVLSTIFPGLGQFYLGSFLKGFFVLFTCFLILPYLYGILDAYTTAKRINRRLGVLL